MLVILKILFVATVNDESDAAKGKDVSYMTCACVVGDKSEPCAV